jgi:triacylglycerol lipase
MSERHVLRGSIDRAGAPGRSSFALAHGSPVLLLHGFLATRRTLAVLERRLLRDGFRVFSVELGGLAGRFNTGDIRELAKIVHDEVERICAREPAMPPFTVIGHSKGGLIAAWWVKHLGGHQRVRAVITLGTPHQGTRIAWAGIPFGWLVPSVVQMRPGSAFLRRLNDGAWPACVQLLSVYSRRDRIVPPGAAIVDAGRAEIRNMEVDVAHSGFLVDGRVYATILGQIRRVEFGESSPESARRAA